MTDATETALLQAIDDNVNLRDALHNLVHAASRFLKAPQLARRENRLREALEEAREALGGDEDAP